MLSKYLMTAAERRDKTICLLFATANALHLQSSQLVVATMLST